MRKDKVCLLLSYILTALICFLPFSSWLVSLLGNSLISLVRDVLVFFIFAASLLAAQYNKIRPKTLFVVILSFLVFGLSSFFWREASLSQWLRGYRFDFLPYILLLPFFFLPPLSDNHIKKILNATIISGGIIIIFSLIEFFGFKLPLISKYSGSLGLISLHAVSGVGFYRIQSILAGPNALGLYLLSIIGFFVGFSKNVKINFYIKLFILLVPGALLIATFSRSALIGLIILVLTAFCLMIKEKIKNRSALLWGFFAICSLFIAGYYLVGNVPKELLTHGDSSKLRLEQYERVWANRENFGFFGKGVGIAGPSSQYRLDSGQNNWTENVYLDIFQELGYIGLAIYLIFLSCIIFFSAKNYHMPEGKTALLLNISYAVGSLFINTYTGQAGIFLVFIANGLMINKIKKEFHGQDID